MVYADPAFFLFDYDAYPGSEDGEGSRKENKEKEAGRRTGKG